MPNWTPEARKAQSERTRLRYQDPEYRAKCSARCKKAANTPEELQRRRDSATNHWADPEYREKRIASMNSPEAKEKYRLATKNLWKTPEYTEKVLRKRKDVKIRTSISNKVKALWEDPEYRKRHAISMSAPEVFLKRSMASKKHWDDPEYKKRFCGESSPQWKGGISFEPYCPKFNKDLKQRIRLFFDHRCVVCGKSTNETGRKLDCHHVEYDKSACCDGKPIQFAALCRKCHSKTNADRARWEAMLHRCIDEMWGGRSYYTKEEYAEICKQHPEEGARP